MRRIFYFKSVNEIKDCCSRKKYSCDFIYAMAKIVRDNMNKPHIFSNRNTGEGFYLGPIDLNRSLFWHTDWLISISEGQLPLDFGE